ADLRDAELGGCNLMEAHLGGAILVDANFMGVDLTRAKGLTRDQLAVAILNEKARFPDYLQAQLPEAKRPKANSGE
ncbi:MAG: pentapeptide repeat-containing protein, partial [Proteobacteria bacterium]|nr:pentapeptide repeat-containing protein [Pseudomonadota bacterium]